ncbi:hypothetical protein ACIA8O_05570 [Kitasatospora sp. NPDC051853]|uniref:hypothetical protein n=1 Tax=Kitasatospora sp. NPDC051853 TaxID=3364058 RepID=UPI0037A250F5
MRFELAARQTAAEELAAWLERRDLGDGIRLITGNPGAGKSRLLVRTACAADAETRELVAAVDGPLPPVGAFDGVADGDGGTGAEWLRSLADGMGLADRIRYDGDVSGLTRALKESDSPLGVLLSGAPGRLRVTVRRSAGVPELVRKLIDPVTAKRPGGGLAFLLAEVDRATLAELLRWKPKLAASVIDLDRERFAPDRAAFTAWVRSLLDAPGSVFADREGDAASAASAVAVAAWPNFLVAEVLARELRARSGEVGTLPGSLEGAWEFVLDAFGRDASRARKLLAPVVLAEGIVGMPGELRLRAAAAVTGDRVTREELSAFEGAVASFLSAAVVEEAGAVPVGHVRLRDGALAEAAAASYGPGVSEVQRRITAVLREALPDDVTAVIRGRSLTAAETYALKFGVGHALDGGRLDEWLADARVLVLGDPEALAEAVAAVGGVVGGVDGPEARRRGAVTEAVQVYRSDSRRGAVEWAARLRFAAQAWGDEELVRTLDGTGLVLPWRADWALWRPQGAFDAREFCAGWTGPVEVVGWRGAVGADGAVCLRSAYDRKYRWYSLTDGVQEGEATTHPPETADALGGKAAGGATVAVVPADGGHGLLRVRVDFGPDGGTGDFGLCAPWPGAQAHPLPDGRLLLAGHSGVALIRFDGAQGHPAGVLSERITDPALLPRDAWWNPGLLAADDLRPYYQGGVAVADPGALGALAGLPEAARVLCETGLPGLPVHWRDTLGSLSTLRSLEDFLADEGVESEVDASGYTVIAVSGDESALCVEHGTGRVVQAFDGEPEVVNTSLTAFATCQALATWALSVSTERHFSERYEFLAFVRAALARVDPGAAGESGPDWWWFQALEDDYTLVG